MNKSLLYSVLTAAPLAFGFTMGIGSVAAQPIDYGTLPVNPNQVTDSSAFIAEAPTVNPQGQPGVEAVFTHRDGTRQVTDSIVVLPDAQAATSAMDQGRAALATQVVGSQTQPAPVGTGGTIVTGTTPDHTQSLAVLTFVEGNSFTTVQFSGPIQDPVPVDLITDYGQMQVAALQTALSA